MSGRPRALALPEGRIRELAASGLGGAAVAAALRAEGVPCRNARVFAAMRASGLSGRIGRPRFEITPVMRRTARRVRGDGGTLADIGRALGWAVSTVWSRAGDLGIERGWAASRSPKARAWAAEQDARDARGGDVTPVALPEATP